MRPLFAHDPLVWVLIGASQTLWSLVETASGRRFSAKGPRKKLDWSLLGIILLACAGGAAAIACSFLGVATIAGPPWWPVIAGLVLIWAGSAFRAWAVFTLGRFFTFAVVVQHDHRVVERGPYRWLRHPSYLGSIVAVTGTGLAQGDWASVAITLLVVLTACAIRIPFEERTLALELGDEYAAYAQRTARLLPGLF
jgi:protein-S-isoprenylcysteine O-methyltransferase Ste14